MKSLFARKSKKSSGAAEVVVQELLPRNVTRPVTDADRELYKAIHGRPLPVDVKLMQVFDTHGRKFQELKPVRHVYEGEALRVAIRRADRWERSGRVGPMPKHIALATAARNESRRASGAVAS